MTELKHLEIEHKFIVEAQFDLDGFKRAVRSLSPSHETDIEVRDVYYVPSTRTPCVLRHRYDRELQHLTMKSLGTNDSEVRTEVNLDLGQHNGDQSAAVQAFLAPFDIIWSGGLRKHVTAFYLPHCEIVHYTATAASAIDNEKGGVEGSQRPVIRCIEFEAVDCTSIEEALAVIKKFEGNLGFDPAHRSKKSLFELLLAPSMPDEVRRRFPNLS